MKYLAGNSSESMQNPIYVLSCSVYYINIMRFNDSHLTKVDDIHVVVDNYYNRHYTKMTVKTLSFFNWVQNKECY